jgi:hypothetical protein
MPRMKILNSVEREVFDFPPIFNSVERKRCFDFPTPLQDIAMSLRTASNQLVFLLSCGYFKATKRFYPVPTFHRRDLTYIADRIAVTLEGIDLTDYPKQTMSRHQAAILNFYGFRAFKPHGRAVLGAEITRPVQSHLKPKLIFSRALDVLVQEKVEVPGYFPLAALILTAINQHNRRLTSTVEALLTPDIRALLDTLLRQESAAEVAAESNAAYKLTLMKKLWQSTKPAKVKERVADLQLVGSPLSIAQTCIGSSHPRPRRHSILCLWRHQSPDLSADPTRRARTVPASHSLYRASITIGCTITWSMSS